MFFVSYNLKDKRHHFRPQKKAQIPLMLQLQHGKLCVCVFRCAVVNFFVRSQIEIIQ